MICKKCGYRSNDVIKVCPNCGSNEIENDFVNFIKCPKCGYENLNSASICKNCEYPLNKYTQKNNQLENIPEGTNVEVSVKTSILTFVIFSVIYTFVPLIILIFVNLRVLSFISVLILLFGIEPLTCLTVKNKLKSTKYLKKELFILSFLFITFWIILFFMAPGTGAWEQRTRLVFSIFMIFIRVIVWFITRKLFIKD